MLIILDKLNLIDLRNNDLTKSILRNAYAAAKKLNYTFNNKTAVPLLKFIDLLPNIPTFDADAYREYWSTNHFIPDDYPEDNDPACQYAKRMKEMHGAKDEHPCVYCPMVGNVRIPPDCRRKHFDEYMELQQVRKHYSVRNWRYQMR